MPGILSSFTFNWLFCIREPEYNKQEAVEKIEKMTREYVILISEYIFVYFCSITIHVCCG